MKFDWDRKNLKFILGIVLAELLLTGIIFFIAFNRPLNNYEIPFTQGTPAVGHFDENGNYCFTMEDGEQVDSAEDKIWFNLSLPYEKGSYTLRIDYKSGAGSKCGLATHLDDNRIAVDCDAVSLDHKNEVATANVVINHKTSDMDFYIRYCGFKTFMIEKITLTGNRKYLGPFFLKWLLGLIILNSIIYMKKK